MLTPKMREQDVLAIQDKKLLQHLADLEKVALQLLLPFLSSPSLIHPQDNFGFTEEDAALAIAEEDGTLVSLAVLVVQGLRCNI